MDTLIRYEYEAEAANLNRRIDMAHDLGMAVLGMPDAFESMLQARRYYTRLAREQTDLYSDVSRLEGQRMDLLDTPHTNTQIRLFSPLKYTA